MTPATAVSQGTATNHGSDASHGTLHRRANHQQKWLKPDGWCYVQREKRGNIISSEGQKQVDEAAALRSVPNICVDESVLNIGTNRRVLLCPWQPSKKRVVSCSEAVTQRPVYIYILIFSKLLWSSQGSLDYPVITQPFFGYYFPKPFTFSRSTVFLFIKLFFCGRGSATALAAVCIGEGAAGRGTRWALAAVQAGQPRRPQPPLLPPPLPLEKCALVRIDASISFVYARRVRLAHLKRHFHSDDAQAWLSGGRLLPDHQPRQRRRPLGRI
jgi:hypothetical protein